MDRWNFEWQHFFALYGALLIINAVTAITENEIGVIGAYLAFLAMLFVSAGLFYQMLKKKATTEGRSAVKWWHVLALYGAALIILNVMMDILKQEIGTIGAYLTIFAMCLVASMFYHVLKKKATDAG